MPMLLTKTGFPSCPACGADLYERAPPGKPEPQNGSLRCFSECPCDPPVKIEWGLHILSVACPDNEPPPRTAAA